MARVNRHVSRCQVFDAGPHTIDPSAMLQSGGIWRNQILDITD